MTRKEFWAIIDSTLDAKNREEQLRLIKTELMKLSDSEIVSFNDIMDELRYDPIFGWLHRYAANIITGFWSDDGYEYFRLWIISKGQSVYENALNNPDSLAEVITQKDIDVGAEFEILGYIAYEVYEEKTGKDNWFEDDPEPEPMVRKPLSKEEVDAIDAEIYAKFERGMGEKWDFSDIYEMYKRYPKLLRRFGLPKS